MAINNIINVKLFDTEIGRIGWDENESRSSFQYHTEFLKEENFINIFPATGIIRSVPQVQVFDRFNNETFKGLPPQFADSLPDVFGSIVFKKWLESSGKAEINVLEQLTYVANRGMGALEYEPRKDIPANTTINLEEIIEVLKSVLDLKKSSSREVFGNEALINVFKMGTSAGGARPKILISKEKNSGAIIPGDLEYSDAYDHYLVKLALDEEVGYPREVVEYCYYLTAKEVGIEMMDSELMEEKHFATKRYDRIAGQKRHVLTATGITGWDFKKPADSSYENLFKLASFLKTPHFQIEELFARMVFNVVFRNTDDHLKNHSFVYQQENDRWKLSPAYDITYALNPLIDFRKANRALSINSKRADIELKDIMKIADQFTIKNPNGIIERIQDGVPFLKERLLEHDVAPKVVKGILDKLARLI